MGFIFGIKSTIYFVWNLSRAPKDTRCLGIHHVFLLPHFNLLSRRIASCGPFSEFHISFESSQFQLSKSLGATREVHSLLRYTLDSNPLPSLVLFRLRFGLYLTSGATDYIYKISLTTFFYFFPSRVFRCARCLATCHALLLSLFDVSSCCAIPSASISTFNTAFRRHQKPHSNAPARVLNNCQSRE